MMKTEVNKMVINADKQKREEGSRFKEIIKTIEQKQNYKNMTGQSLLDNEKIKIYKENMNKKEIKKKVDEFI